jgi:ATP-binding cassette subfamily B protein
MPSPLNTLLRRLWRHLGNRRQKQFLALGMLILLGAGAEVVSLGAVLPFLGILVAPERAFQHPAVAHLAGILHWSRPDQLVLPLTVAFLAAVLGAGSLRMLLLWANTRLTFAIAADLGFEVYRRTLYQPYPVHLARNSSEVISSITTKVHFVVYNIVQPILTLASTLVLIVAILATLFAISPGVALVCVLGFGGGYTLVTLFTRRRLRLDGERAAQEQTRVVKALQEGLGGIRDVLLDGSQPAYCRIYLEADRPLRKAQAHYGIVSQAPRFVMESLGMVLIAALAYGLAGRAGGIGTALPVLGALALGAQRLLPALQQAFNAWTSLVGYQATLADTLQFLEQPLPPEATEPEPEPLPFEREMRFEEVGFRYHEEGPWVLRNFDLTVPRGARIGFVGPTGCGKSTTLDLLMGLLKPTEGRILVDGEPLEGPRLRAWQRNIAHVPQAIFLADTTLAENIAFGVPKEQIDLDRVRQAARKAQIADFIESRPEGYGARVGERGIQLSGGQRQRIGIARALYKQATVLVFDEATSALDHATEGSVMDAINNLGRDLTIVLIAHRLSTVERCDSIVQMGPGESVELNNRWALVQRAVYGGAPPISGSEQQ